MSKIPLLSESEFEELKRICEREQKTKTHNWKSYSDFLADLEKVYENNSDPDISISAFPVDNFDKIKRKEFQNFVLHLDTHGMLCLIRKWHK